MRASAAEAAGYRIRRATDADDGAVARELAAYLAFLGEALDGEGLDRDIAQWRSAYDGDHGVLLVVVDPDGEMVGTAAVRRLEPGIGETQAHVDPARAPGQGARPPADGRLSRRRHARSAAAGCGSTASGSWRPRCISTAPTDSSRCRTTTATAAPRSGWSARSSETRGASRGSRESVETERPLTRARRGMVTCPHALASEAGVEALRAGGSAVDAAIAASAVLAVVYPHMTSLGGDAFWLDLSRRRTARVRAFLDAGGAATAARHPRRLPRRAASPRSHTAASCPPP